MSACHSFRPDQVRTHVLVPLGLDAAGEDAELRAACEAAFERGAAHGRREAEEGLRTAADALRSALAATEREGRETAERRRRELLQLSLVIARQVVMAELKTRPELIECVVVRLMEEAGERGVSALRLNPQDAALLKGSPAGAALEKSGIVLRAHDDIEPGGCVAETRFGLLDARVSTRLEELAAALTGEREAVASPRLATEGAA
jgi:flagellar assembly protein FliH